ncbi:MAG: dihydrofolate reductase family protein [Actinomycetes bacterium]
MFTNKPGSERWVRANLVLGMDGATTKNGSSKGLSSRTDRARFHEIRSMADLILIGGQTARSEPYESTPVPLIVISRSPSAPHRASANPMSRTLDIEPAHLITTLDREKYPRILVEGGYALMHALLLDRALDGIYLTLAEVLGDSTRIDLDILLSDIASAGLLEKSREEVNGDSFLLFTR